jgi:nucleoside-triphosphatase THEP1
MQQSSTSLAFAAVALAPETDAGTWLATVIERLRSAGIVIGGMNAADTEGGPWECRRPMYLRDLLTGETIKISQDLGPAAQGCALDTGQLALAGRSVHRAIEAGVSLVVVNKFGAQEAAGAGLRDELFAAAEAGIPVLTTVKPELVDAWCEFVGELGELLLPDVDRVEAWCRAVCATHGR